MEVQKKRMLEVHEAPNSDNIVVSINSSSLDVIQTCKRKTYYFIERQIRSEAESPTTLFGTAIHKGLETWYLSRDEDAAIEAFKHASKALVSLHDKDKRHPNNGITILKNYFNVYRNDPFEIVSDDKGPLIERDFEALFTEFIFKRKIVTVNLFGRIDCILRNRDTDEIFVCDHKTTSSLGQQFYQRISPNFQYTTYLWAAQKVLGLNTNRFLVNGIQVAKTKSDLARQFTTRDDTDYSELKIAIVSAVTDYLANRLSGEWPMNAPGPCTNWGGCQYREVCSVPPSVRESLLKNLFEDPSSLNVDHDD